MNFLKISIFFVACFSPIVCFSNTSLLKVTKLKDSPIIYNDETDEYYIVWKFEESGESRSYKLKLKYDPFTGKALGSASDSSFVEPDKDEILRVREQLKEFDTIDDVIAFYGEPDRVVEKHGGGTQFDFEREFDTIKLIVSVGAEGKTSAIFFPKKKREVREGERESE